METVTKTVDSLSQNIISLLRYVFPPIVGLLVVLVGYGCDLGGIAKVSQLKTIHMFLSLFIVIALGLTIYHFHRIILHHIFSFVITRIVRNEYVRKLRGEAMDLNFARWIRQGSVENKDAQSIQNALDKANAGVHFLFCSCWSVLMWVFIFRVGLNQKASADPPPDVLFCKSSLDNPVFFWCVFGGLLVAAIVGEFWTSFYDLKVYEDYKEN